MTSGYIGKGSLSKDILKRSTGSGRFVFLDSDFAQIFGRIVSRRAKTLSRNTNLVATRHIKIIQGPSRLTCAVHKRLLAKEEEQNFRFYFPR